MVSTKAAETFQSDCISYGWIGGRDIAIKWIF